MSATITRGIGGSDVAAICGLSPYKTAADVYARVIEGVRSEAGTRARLGNLAEPEILRDYCERHDFPMDQFETSVEIERPDKPFMRGELDALFRGNHGVECKLVGWRQADRWGDDGSDFIPDEYLCQVAWYTMLADVPFMRIAAWFDGGGDYREFQYDRNEDLEGTLVEKVEKFWTDHVEAKTPPSLVGADADSIRAIFPKGNGDLREAKPDEVALIEEFARLNEERKGAEKAEKEVKARLQAAIADNDGVYCSLGKVTWKEVNRKAKTDWEGVAKALKPSDELINEHTKVPASYRRFLFSPKKG